MIVALGLDLVELDRFGKALERSGPRFQERVFTPAEREAASSLGRSMEYLAGRFAAKEAVLKCLGTGWARGVRWRDIEILSRPSGEPLLSLSGKALQVARKKGIARWRISITHTSRTAAAVALAEGA